jgi:DNA-binding beta-propeller fold protein YncE
VAWDAAGNIFVADGYSNARVAKFDKTGRFAKSWGSTGAEPGQFNIPHSLAVDAQGNVYVADMGNKRIQVFDNDGTFKTQITNVGAPRAICISPGAHQYLYSSNSNPTEDPFLNGEIYRCWTARGGRFSEPASSSSGWSILSRLPRAQH